MKTSVPNLMINPTNNDLLYRKPLILMMKRLLLLLVFVLYGAGITAQDLRTSAVPRALEVKAYIASLKTAELSSISSNLSSNRLEHLLNDVQPATYFTSGEVQTYGDAPNSLFTNSSSLSNIGTSNIASANIEIVTITLSMNVDLSRSIDLSVFSNFPNLKYIYILSNVETTESVINGLIRNNDGKFGVFYKIDKGA